MDADVAPCRMNSGKIAMMAWSSSSRSSYASAMLVCKVWCALGCGDEQSVDVVCVMAAQHGRRQTLLFCSLAAPKPGETVSARIDKIQVFTATEQIDLSTRPYPTSRYSASRYSAVARELVGVLSVFWKPPARGLGQNARL